MTEDAQVNLLLIGGHTRNIGKTALVVDLIRAFPEAAWTAVKITQYGHGVCSINGENCGCAPDQHTFSLEEEHSRENRTDTSRFLVAGAARSLWLRTKQGRLAEALPLLRHALAGAGNVIIESNSLRNFLRPALYLVVLDPEQADFKPSAQRLLDHASAFVLRSGFPDRAWSAVAPGLLQGRPVFHQPLGAPLPPGLDSLVRATLFPPATPEHHLSS
jgi:hypothetical protein